MIAKTPQTFATTLVVGVLLAAGCWKCCGLFARLWNQHFHLRPVHHLACGFSALLTFCFVLTFASMQHIREATIVSIAVWQLQIQADPAWAENTYAKAFQRVRELGIEDFTGIAPPSTPGSRIPTQHDESRRAAATVFAEEACLHFDRSRPFLSKITWSRPILPAETVLEDVRRLQNERLDYPPERAIMLTATQIRAGLAPQVPRVGFVTRVSTTLLFLLVQSGAFGFIGLAASRDIRPRI